MCDPHGRSTELTSSGSVLSLMSKMCRPSKMAGTSWSSQNAVPGGVRVPGAHDEVLEDDHVSLVAVAERPPDLLGIVRIADVTDVEPVPVALDGELAPERDVGVDVGVPDAGFVRLAGSKMWPRGTRSGVLVVLVPCAAASGNAMIPITIAAKSGTRNNLLMSTSYAGFTAKAQTPERGRPVARPRASPSDVPSREAA